MRTHIFHEGQIRTLAPRDPHNHVCYGEADDLESSHTLPIAYACKKKSKTVSIAANNEFGMRFPILMVQRGTM